VKTEDKFLRTYNEAMGKLVLVTILAFIGFLVIPAIIMIGDTTASEQWLLALLFSIALGSIFLVALLKMLVLFLSKRTYLRATSTP